MEQIHVYIRKPGFYPEIFDRAEHRVYVNKLREYITRASHSTAEVRFNYGVKWLVMCTPRGTAEV